VTGRGYARGTQAGVTLVELLVAVAIGALLLALAFNGQSLLANRHLTGAARNLASDMRMLEQRARTERICYRIVFDLSAETYTMEKYTGVVTPAPAGGGDQCPDTSWSMIFREDPTKSYSRRMPRDVELASTTFVSPLNTLVFSPLGNPNGGRARLQTKAGGMWREVVAEITGRVKIEP
jgi:prepilin-type N-terminal cleavage/methylation domain-containing protein